MAVNYRAVQEISHKFYNFIIDREQMRENKEIPSYMGHIAPPKDLTKTKVKVKFWYLIQRCLHDDTCSGALYNLGSGS